MEPKLAFVSICTCALLLAAAGAAQPESPGAAVPTPAPSPAANAATDDPATRMVPDAPAHTATSPAVEPPASDEHPSQAAHDQPGRGHDASGAQHAHEHTHVIVHRHEHEHEARYGAVARASHARAASERTFTTRELPRGPNLGSAELLRVVPGLHVIQHAGGGKANQYFLRGFDSDHGTDLALTVDGVPVNLVSHGHGQGYSDLHWTIPELIERIELHKGPYDPRYGDFATAGALALESARSTPESRATLQGGMFRSYRALAIVGSDVDRLSVTGAAELYRSDGPFDPAREHQRYNLFARAAHPLAGGEVSLTATAYGSAWDASGQIPLRAVQSGMLDRFGSVDPSEGGSSTRSSLYARFRSGRGLPQRWEVLAYLVRSRFDLYSNFTLFSADELAGDMIHQRDARTLAGFKLRYGRDDEGGPFTFSSRFGIELRHDDIENGLDRAPRRELGATLVSARIDESALSAFLEEEIEWLSWLRTLAAARIDGFFFSVRDALEDRSTVGTARSGERNRTRVSPKASLVIAPRPWAELYASVGLGFHSNDARGVVLGVTPLTRALGYEIGVRSRVAMLIAELTLFRIDLDSELVWVGDEGTTEPSGRTRRDGIELDLRADVLRWLRAEAALSLVRARFRDAARGEDAVPLAPTRVVSGSLTAHHSRGLYARFTLLHLGDRAATEERFLTAAGFTRLDLTLGYRYTRYELGLRLENLSNARYRESQFATVSRLPGERDGSVCPPATRARGDGSFAGCEDVHFTPGFPFAAHASASVYF